MALTPRETRDLQVARPIWSQWGQKQDAIGDARWSVSTHAGAGTGDDGDALELVGGGSDCHLLEQEMRGCEERLGEGECGLGYIAMNALPMRQ